MNEKEKHESACGCGLCQWKKVARDLARAVTQEQMLAAYDAYITLRGEEEE